MVGVFLALGILFVGGAIVFFGDPAQIKKMVARVILDEPAKSGEKAATTRKRKQKTASERRGRTVKKERPPERPGYVNGRHAFDPSQLVAVNPPQGFATHAGQLGFVTTEKIRLKTLKVSIHRMEKTGKLHAHEAMATLRKKFKTASADVNALYDVAQAGTRSGGKPLSKVRELARWPQAGPGCGKHIRIGMIDTPVDRRHDALKGRLIVRKSFHDPERKPASALHGTAIAAMFVGRPTEAGFGGLLPEARLYAANIFERDEFGETRADSIAFARALDWLAGKRPHVINISLAGIDSKAVRKAIAIARKKKLIIVAAAGSWGRDADPAYPAAMRDVIAITAVEGGLAPYRKANRGRYIDFAAPGVNVWTAIPGGGRFQTGSSFAAPFGSAAVALAVASGVRKSPRTLREHLKPFAVDVGNPGKDNTYGWGVLKLDQPCGT